MRGSQGGNQSCLVLLQASWGRCVGVRDAALPIASPQNYCFKAEKLHVAALNVRKTQSDKEFFFLKKKASKVSLFSFSCVFLHDTATLGGEGDPMCSARRRCNVTLVRNPSDILPTCLRSSRANLTPMEGSGSSSAIQEETLTRLGWRLRRIYRCQKFKLHLERLFNLKTSFSAGCAFSEFTAASSDSELCVLKQKKKSGLLFVLLHRRFCVVTRVPAEKLLEMLPVF